ncbi:MarR family transcriptional regulator [Psychrobacter sp. HD31]|uniref:MarR family winged helix-turn-helix transcriptional regulator n=1 Tax=Psychrobacter sp. HD31 TaxID=3112003 RepID=UPI003DA4E357
MDTVDIIIHQWQQQGFDSQQLLAMETLGRIKRLDNQLMKKISDIHKANHDIAMWEFDVLATLRRAGEPYCLSPTELFASTMVTSGAMTNRLNQLSKRGFIRRVANPVDKRSLLVQLSDDGLKLINQAIIEHIDIENQLLKNLDIAEIRQLNKLLSKI